MVKQMWPDIKPVLIALQFEAAPIDNKFCAVCHTGFDQSQDIRLGRRRHHGSVIDIVATGVGADFQLLNSWDQPFDQRICGRFTNRNRD